MKTGPTVRSRILAEIKRRLLAISNVGAVYQFDRVDARKIAECVKQGKYVCELTAGNDEADTEKPYQLELVAMTVGILVHMPDPLPLDGVAVVPAEQIAAGVHASIYELYATAAAGQWAEGGSGPALARTTAFLSGGGVFEDDELGTTCTEHAMEIRFGFSRADMNVAG